MTTSPVDSNDPFLSSGGGDHPRTSAEAIVLTLRRRAWQIALLTCAGVVVGVAHSVRQPEVFQASSTILIAARPPRVVDKVGDVVEDQSSDPERFTNSQVRLLTSQYMAELVERRLGRPKGSLFGRVSVTLDRSSQMATLSVIDPDASSAVRLVNAFTDVYVESTVADRAGIALDAAQFLGTESHSYRQRLESDERTLYEFQRHNELPASNFEDSHKIISSNLQALHAQQSQAYAAGVRLHSQLAEITAAEGNWELKRRLTLWDAPEHWTNLRDRYLILCEQVTQLEARYGQRHPKVVEAREAREVVGNQLDQEADTAVRVVRSRARANASEQAELKAAITTATSHAVALRQKELEYNRLVRTMEEDREAYGLVARRQKEIELQAALKQSYVRRLDAATVAAPIGRKVPRNIMASLILGLGLGIALAFLLDFIDDTFKSPEEVEHFLSSPLLGFITTVPVPPDTQPTQLELERAKHIVNNPRSPVAEQCHNVSTNIFSLFVDGGPRSLMVVSAATEDGKTMVAVNLATTAAARGKRVVLIDGDLRRGRLHSLLGLSRRGGLFDVLTGRITIEEATRPSGLANVDVITTGEVPVKVSPLRILELDTLIEVVQALKERYDLILFDTPPVPMVSDALLLQDAVDGAVGVVRAGKTSSRLARHMEKQLAFARINFLGWVLNGVSDGEIKEKYYYRYGRYHGGLSEELPPKTA